MESTQNTIVKKWAKRLMGFSEESWTRVILNQETDQLISKLQPANLKVLEISGQDWQKFGFKEYKSLSYPEFDVCESALTETFDLIIAEQVFEHLLWPYRAGKNIYQMLNPGGYFLITTPFLIRVHNCPTDCSRWTETGLQYFLAECGFPLENSYTGSWGNRACVRANLHPKRFMPYHKWLHSKVNEPDFPVMVWGLTRKT